MTSEANSKLYDAIRRGDVVAVRRAIEAGADVNAPGGRSNTVPLCQVVMTGMSNPGRKDMLEQLAKAGADPNIADEFGHTPLHKAASKEDTDSAAVLLDMGAKVNAAEKFGVTPLHIAVNTACMSANGWTGMIDLLIGKGADILAETTKGKTPADFAREQKTTTVHGGMIENFLAPREKQALEERSLREQEDRKRDRAAQCRTDFNRHIEEIRKHRPPPLKSRRSPG